MPTSPRTARLGRARVNVTRRGVNVERMRKYAEPAETRWEPIDVDFAATVTGLIRWAHTVGVAG